MSRIWLDLIEENLRSRNKEIFLKAVKQISEDDTGDVTSIEAILASYILEKEI